MKLNKEFINKIFNNEKSIKSKNDKIKLSKYEELIPMYDIYSEKIYPISKENIYYRLIHCHYRFINDEIKKWIENKYKKRKEQKLLDNLKIIDNYDLDTLMDTSYKLLYKFSHQLGLQISICKRNSFNRYAKHLKPYYSKDELIKLGMNMSIIKKEYDLNDSKIHYDICKKISKNDISNDEILNHNNFIIENKLISTICNYSFMGSYFMNRYLRGFDKNTNNFTIEIINKLNNLTKSPKLNNDYFLYRFIWDDTFLKKLKIGDKFIDKGFMSTTRDPFYSPGLKSNFGLILVKIKIPKSKNVGLLIENFSLFPKEEEYLLPPNSEFKLLSRDDKFKYYHTNSDFENVIKTKYEFEYTGTKFKKYILSEQYHNFKILDEIEINEENKINIFKNFISNYESEDNIIYLKKSDREYKINYHWFDGTDSYNKFYYNKIKNGLIFNIYDENHYPYLNIEFGEEMVINYLNQYYLYDTKKFIDKKDVELLANFAYIFRYDSFKIYLDYKNFSEVSKIEEKNKSYLYNNLYCDSLYEYLKDNKKFLSYLEDYKDFFNYKLGYFRLNKIKNEKLPVEMYKRFEKLYDKNLSISDFIIDIIENNFYYYDKLESLFKQYNIENIFESLYLNFDIISYYSSKNIKINKLNINYDNNYLENNNDYKLVFRQPIRRIN